MRVVLSVSLPGELARSLEEFARFLHVGKSDLMREAIRRYLWEEKFEALRKKAGAVAAKQGFLTDEDHLVMKKFRGIPILTPRRLEEILSQKA